MRILFPASSASSTEPDPVFADEIAAAEALGFGWSLYALGEVRAGVPQLRCCPEGAGPLLHRGWMMSGAAYRRLQAGAEARGCSLVVPPDAYEQAHYLPLAFPLLGSDTPFSVWNASEEVEAAWALYGTMADQPAILKDWVKSAKARWREACYIPAHTDRERFGSIFAAFRAERGRLFERGVVLRRFHRLYTRGKDMRGMPIHEEHRLFFWRGELLATSASDSALAHLDRWRQIARRFESPFLTLDVALEEDGGWVVIESGDGGVSGLPLQLPARVLYQALRAVRPPC